MKKLVLLLAIILLPAAGFAQSGTTGSLTWSLSGGTLTISGNGEMPDYALYAIPMFGLYPAPWADYRSNITAVIIGNGVTSIGDYAFYSFQNLISVTVPNSVTSIGDYAFDNCFSLSSITLPNKVAYIGRYAFSNTALTSITIPGSVTGIGDDAFSYCSGLTSVTVEWATPLSISDDVFYDVPLNSIVLYVPAGTQALYAAANVWKEFKTIDDTGTDVVETSEIVFAGGILSVTTPKAEQVEVYSVGGQLLFTARKDGGKATFDLRRLPRGVLIVRGSSGWGEKIINN